MSGIDNFFLKALEFVMNLISGLIKGTLEQLFPQFNRSGCLGLLIVAVLTMFCCTILTMFF